MRILGIDYGDARVGIAVSDLLGFMAQGVRTIKNRGTEKEAKEYYFEQQLQRAEEETARQKARKLFEQRRQEQTRKVV